MIFELRFSDFPLYIFFLCMQIICIKLINNLIVDKYIVNYLIFTCKLFGSIEFSFIFAES